MIAKEMERRHRLASEKKRKRCIQVISSMREELKGVVESPYLLFPTDGRVSNLFIRKQTGPLYVSLHCQFIIEPFIAML